ncbi:putative calcium binding protein [Helianthus annuus]|uniref:Calcium binding protein n=1 Tax=Helianthus annuus TaxID=4232 RepID=A0A251TFX5_HELAN|nr:calcium-binding protein CP1 [Helianthus annuus]KAF5784546.1 putative calcium binding protein [Helianthus annuus]KAJ0512234.1 putative EF-hand domain-containing protein [Helianthus annuus]KAJ0519663.1 putative EF-hand domain-containing protein [Helianthus annuus]KAJ0691447.1 putative EF-hand domain-containing protein [Helianthus annuus]
MCPTGTSLSPATKAADLRSAFEILDVDHDGKISHEDLKTFYTDASDDVIGTMMTVADSNKNGYVEYEEFEKVVKENNREGGVMEDVFNDMDRDGDGKVGHEDLRSYLSSAGIQVNDDDIKAMVRLGSGGGGDTDDGVTFEGFLRILLLAAV